MAQDMIDVFEGGEARFLGTHEQTPEQLTEQYRAFGEHGPDATPPLIPQDQWVPTWKDHGDNNDVYIAKQGGIGDQNGQGACGSISAVELQELTQLKSGYTADQFKKLSWGMLYWSVNGGSDRGTLPEENLKRLRTAGVADTTKVAIDVRNPRQRWDQDTLDNAKSNVIEEWFLAPTINHFVSGLMQGFCGHLSVWWYDRDKVNSKGQLPVNPGGRRGGHSLRGTELVFEDNQWWIRGPNTWTPGWGDRGFFKLPFARAIENIRQWPWWLTKSVRQKDGNMPPPIIR